MLERQARSLIPVFLAGCIGDMVHIGSGQWLKRPDRQAL